MIVPFSKMHGLGNDFVVIDNVTNAINLTAEQIQTLSDRHFGIGFDQLLLVEPPYDPDLDFHYRIFNANGTEVGQCGNGARCFAKFVLLKGLIDRPQIKVSTQGTKITLYIERNGNISVNMGNPIRLPSAIPFIANKPETTYILRINQQTILCGVVSMGNPHCVIVVDDITQAPVETLGPLLECHERFPERVNVGFMQIVSSNEIKLRVWERGVGETLACGTGACAAVVVGILQQKLKQVVQVNLLGGQLTVRWRGPDYAVKMTGPAQHVFDGQITL